MSTSGPEPWTPDADPVAEDRRVPAVRSRRRVVATERRLGPGRGPEGRERLLAMIERLEPEDRPAVLDDAFPNAEDRAPSAGEPETDPRSRSRTAESSGTRTRDRGAVGRGRAEARRAAGGRLWRYKVSPRAVRGFLLLAAAAVLAVVLLLPDGGRTDALDAAPPGDQTDGVPTGPETGAAASASAAVDAPGAETAAGGAVAHVVGAVRRPGLVRLPAGAVVDDAVKAAGGAQDSAALESVNLAEPVRNGAQIRIPTREEAARGEPGGQLTAAAGNNAVPGHAGGSSVEESSSGGTTVPGSGGPAPTGGAGGGATGGTGAKINLNTATAEQLETLPRVGPKMAQKILDYRTAHGRFASVQEIDAVPGIGPAMLAALEPLVTV